jgi:hypothetical protein
MLLTACALSKLAAILHQHGFDAGKGDQNEEIKPMPTT